MISIKVLSCVLIQTKQTNISIFSPIFRLTVSFADPFWFAVYSNQGSQKDVMANFASLFWLSKNLTFAEDSGATTFTLTVRLHDMRSKVNSNQFGISNCFEKLFHVHGNFTAAICVIAIERIDRNQCY